MTVAEMALLAAFYGIILPGAGERSLRDALADFVGVPSMFHA